MSDKPQEEFDDFLHVLLTLDQYKSNNNLIIDECNNFFTAGSGTVSAAT